MHLQNVLPADIERRSMEIITEELGGRTFGPLEDPIVKRVIHTTADFAFADNLFFSPGAAEKAAQALKNGATVVTDTNMAWTGINKTVLERLGGKAVCYMADEDVAAAAKKNGVTRAAASMEKAAALPGPLVFAIGNAPTALVRLCELMAEGGVKPALVIGAPVGFVNVVESKEILLQMDVPQIVAKGRKGGSAVAATIVNALLYQL